MRGISVANYKHHSDTRDLTGSNEVDDRQRPVLSLERVFHHDGSHLVLRREALHFAILDGAQEGTLATSVRCADTISPSTNESEGGVR